MGRYNNQNGTKIETQINELSDSFQEYNVNAMNTRSTKRSGDGSWNGSFDRSSSKNNSFNSPQNSVDQITEAAITQVTMTGTTDKNYN